MSPPASIIVRSRQVAAMLGRSPAWFYERRAELERAGFPRKDELLGGWNRLAVEQWLARRAGLVERSAVDEAREAARRGIAEAKARRDAVRHQPAR